MNAGAVPHQFARASGAKTSAIFTASDPTEGCGTGQLILATCRTGYTTVTCITLRASDNLMYRIANFHPEVPPKSSKGSAFVFLPPFYHLKLQASAVGKLACNGHRTGAEGLSVGEHRFAPLAYD